MDVKDLLTNPPENVEDISTIESAVSELEQIYKEMKSAIEKDERERVERLKSRMVKPVVSLIKAGYTEDIIKRALRGMGVKEEIISDIMIEAWRIIENRKVSTTRKMEIILIIGVIVVFGLTYLILVGMTKPSQCHSFGCANEIIKCQPGKYIATIGTTKKQIILQRSGNRCIITERIIYSTNRTAVGRYFNCIVPMVDGISNISDLSECSGTLSHKSLF